MLQRFTACVHNLLLLLAISTAFATVTLNAYTITKNVFAYILIYWVLIRQVGDLKRLRQVFLTLTFVHLAIAALNPRLFTNPDSRLGINSGAFLGDGNDFSLSVNICIPLCLFLMLESRRIFTKLLWIAALLALGVGDLFFQRGPLGQEVAEGYLRHRYAPLSIRWREYSAGRAPDSIGKIRRPAFYPPGGT